MFGIPDFWIWSAYLLCILGTAICVIYGIINWNRGANDELNEIHAEEKWETSEKEIEANL